MLHRLQVVVVVAALTGAGCGAGDDDATTTTTMDETTTTTVETTTTTARDGSAACSAAGLDADVDDRSELPVAVAETRRRIVAAATACDFDALAELAEGTDEMPFTYSFGDSGDPAGHWQREEERGTGQPLRHLVEILDRPHARLEAPGPASYAWPSAFAYESWEQVPDADREALRPLYGDEDLRRFERFGGYIGYRAIITEDGTWTVFVAGD